MLWYLWLTMFPLPKYFVNNTLLLHVIPNSSRTKLIEENGKLKLYLLSVPEKNKANLELIKFFKKEYGLKVGIKTGLKSKDKVIFLV